MEKIDNYVWGKLAEAPLNYHSVGREMPEAYFIKVADHICKNLEISADHNVADIGCASGMITKFLSAKARSCVGVDLSIPLIKLAKKHNCFDSMSYCVGEGAKIPLRDNWADRVNCYDVFLLYPSYDYALESVKELSRICKPGGKIFIADITDIKKKRRYTWDRITLYRKIRKVIGLFIPIKLNFWIRKKILHQKIADRKGQPWIWFDLDKLRYDIHQLGLRCNYMAQPEELVAGYYRSSILINNTK